MRYEQRRCETIKRVAEFLSKLRWLIGELKKFYQQDTIQIHPEFLHVSTVVTCILKYSKSIQKCAELRMEMGSLKFTRSYGHEVHQFMAQENMAPKLLFTKELPGGWLSL